MEMGMVPGMEPVSSGRRSYHQYNAKGASRPPTTNAVPPAIRKFSRERRLGNQRENMINVCDGKRRR